MPDEAVALVNGEPGALVSWRDRGLQYGDGLFETMVVRDGTPLLWNEHINRLRTGCERLHIECPDARLLARESQHLIGGRNRAVLKIVVTRGQGGRGYRPSGEGSATRVLSIHSWSPRPGDLAKSGVRLRICDTRLGINPALAGLKHLNRLEQVLAGAEWSDPAIAEGIMLDVDGRVVEGTMSNVFVVADGVLMTPDLHRCGVAGVMRETILVRSRRDGIPSRVGDCFREDLFRADELFVCNSVIGLWPVCRIEQRCLEPGPMTHRLQALLSDSMI